MEHFDAFVVDVDERQVVQLLQDEVAWVVENVGAGVVLHFLQEPLEGHAVVQVFAGMDFVAAVHAVFLEHIENRPPTRGEFLKARLHQASGTLRPRIHHRPQQCAGERDVARQTQIAARLRRQLHLFDGPSGALGRLAVQMFGGEAVEERVVGRVDRHQLPFEMGREFGDFHATFAHTAGQIVAVGFAFRRLGDVDERRIADGHLNADEAEIRGPLGHRLDVVEGIFVGHELG